MYGFKTSQSHSKKKTNLYQERCELKRQSYKAILANYNPEKLVYIDESGIDKFIARDYGWARKGEKVYGEVSGKRFARESFIAGYHDNKVIAPMCYQGTCDTLLFNYWLEQFLLPELKPGHVLIMDNAAFHKSNETKQLIEKAKCELLFLPPYSPDLNPIEKLWAKLKKIIKKCLKNFSSLGEAIDHAFCGIV